MEKRILEVKRYLSTFGIDGWLLYNFQSSNPLALQFLKIPESTHLSRRLFYWIPQEGDPVKIVHCIEEGVLDHLPGEKRIYLKHEQLASHLSVILKKAKIVAMEYSKDNHIPYISKVDAGTKELVESFGPKVVSSGDFLQHFTCILTEEQKSSHRQAGVFLDQLAESAFTYIKENFQSGKAVNEYQVQQWIMGQINAAGYMTDSSPAVAFAENTANPHYSPLLDHSKVLKKGDIILLDIVAKKKGSKAVYADITRMGIAASAPTEKQQKVFSCIYNAQEKTYQFIQKRFEEKLPVKGFEADKLCREYVKKAGFSDFFIHRTGHNVFESVHGPGAHLDSLETFDERLLLPSTVFTIEPGIYFSGDFGVRVEYDVLIESSGKLEITSGIQDKIHCLF